MLIDLHAHAPHPDYFNQHPHWGPFFEQHADGDVKLRVGDGVLTLGALERKAALRAGTLKIEDYLARWATADRLTNLIAIYCIVSWRIFWMTMLKRADPDSNAAFAFTDPEIKALDCIRPDNESWVPQPKALSQYLTKLAKLGGYLARKNDPPPGNMVIWRGLTRLTDIVLGMRIAREVVGN
jgi:hypothetical protein